MQILTRMHCETDSPESIACHCLQVGESTITDAIAIAGLASVKEVCRETGAGGGCTACHARLRELIRQARTSAPVC